MPQWQHPNVLDSKKMGMEGALGKRPACPCSWGSRGSRRHGQESTSDGGGGVVGNPCHVDVQALEEKEERDGSSAKVSHDV